MNLKIIKTFLLQKTRVSPAALSEQDLTAFAPVISNNDIREYLEECLPASSYVASGISVLNLEDIRGYSAEGCSPGGYLLPFGYLVIGVNIGGNAVCFSSGDGRVYWADHVTFTSTITYRNRNTGNWEEWGEYTSEKIQRALVLVSDSIEGFLAALLKDRLTAQLEALD